MRYGFDLGWVALQESYQALHATAFLLAGAWVLRRDEHVRVDVWYRGRSVAVKAWVNLLGALLLLLPVCGFIGGAFGLEAQLSMFMALLHAHVVAPCQPILIRGEVPALSAQG